MLKDDWEELAAQVESHGPEAINFYLDDGDESNGNLLGIDVQNISFEDNEIKVVLF